jgi:hypothetical protein
MSLWEICCLGDLAYAKRHFQNAANVNEDIHLAFRMACLRHNFNIAKWLMRISPTTYDEYVDFAWHWMGFSVHEKPMKKFIKKRALHLASFF